MNPVISFVLPCYKRFDLFCKAVAHNHLFCDARCEVVLVLDTPEEEALYKGMIRGHWGNHIRFRMVVNDQEHEWRPPCKAINVGIRHSIGEYIAVMSPESILMLPSTDFLWQQLHVEKWRKFFLTGLVGDVAPNELSADFSHKWFNEIINHPTRDEFGFILATKGDLSDIGGYDERRKGFSGDDNCIRRRLERHGIKHVNCSQIRVGHLSHDNGTRKEGQMAEPICEEIVMPNQRTWGTEYARISLDWRKQ